MYAAKQLLSMGCILKLYVPVFDPFMVTTNVEVINEVLICVAVMTKPLLFFETTLAVEFHDLPSIVALIFADRMLFSLLHPAKNNIPKHKESRPIFDLIFIQLVFKLLCKLFISSFVGCMLMITSI